MKKRKKVGLALGSGGVKGLAHVGIIKALTKNNIPIDFIAGSSIGAWIGAHYALFKDIEKLEEYTVDRKKEKLSAFLEPALKGGLIKGFRVEKLFAKWLNDANFSDTKIPLSIVANDLITGNQIIISKGKLAPAVRASVSVPTIFKPVEYRGSLLVDGGICNPVPDNILRNMGADIVISVNLEHYQKGNYFSDKNLTLGKTANRSLDIMRHYLAEYSTINSDIILKPKVTSVGFSSWRKYFTEKTNFEIVKAGQREAENNIIKIKKFL